MYNGVDQNDQHLWIITDAKKHSTRNLTEISARLNSCHELLCNLQSVSKTASFKPVLNLANRGLHLVLQTTVATLKLQMKVLELKQVFEDFAFKLKAFADYLKNHGADKTIDFSSGNYFMVSILSTKLGSTKGLNN